MNFLLHHAFAHAELGDARAAIGAMLPDLWRMAHPRVRARPDVTVDDDAGVMALARGIEHHLAIDAWFHRTEVFLRGEADLRRALRALAAPKLGLFAHVGWELCLDGAWVRRKDPADDLRRGFEAVAGKLEPLAELHAQGKLAELDLAAFHARVRRLCDALVGPEWLPAYLDGAGIARQLEAIRVRRFGLPPMSPATGRQLAELFEDGLVRAADALDRLTALRATHV